MRKTGLTDRVTSRRCEFYRTRDFTKLSERIVVVTGCWFVFGRQDAGEGAKKAE